MNLYAITFKSRKGARIIGNGENIARANGTTAYDTRRDKISVAIDEEATIADYELTLKCCGSKRFINQDTTNSLSENPNIVPINWYLGR